MQKKNPTIQQTDRRVPLLAKTATRAAFSRALKAGYVVIVAKDAQLQRVHPDGRIEVLKKIKPDVKMAKGTVIRID